MVKKLSQDEFDKNAMSVDGQYFGPDPIWSAIQKLSSQIQTIWEKLNNFKIPKDGVDGKTPIPGIDFPIPKNGVDGKTPIPGIDFSIPKDGVDGKTPMPGVDFPIPKDGAPGKDAVIPTLKLTVGFGKGRDFDRLEVNGKVLGPHLTGPQGPGGSTGKKGDKGDSAKGLGILTQKLLNTSDTTILPGMPVCRDGLSIYPAYVDPDYPEKSRVIAMATEIIPPSQSGVCNFSGPCVFTKEQWNAVIEEDSDGLVPGLQYYLSPNFAGKITGNLDVNALYPDVLQLTMLLGRAFSETWLMV